MTGNFISNCGKWGMYTENEQGGNSKDKVSGNIILNVGRESVNIWEGNPVVSNNVIRNAEHGIFIWENDSAVIMNNLVSDTSGNGFRSEEAINTRFSQNTLVNTGDGGEKSIYIEDGTLPLKEFTKNNILDYDCPLDIEGTITKTIKMKQNFWGDLENPMPDLTCDAEANAALATDPGLVMKPSSKPNRVKYKSPF